MVTPCCTRTSQLLNSIGVFTSSGTVPSTSSRVLIEPVVDCRKEKRKRDFESELPPLPQERDLFCPPDEREIIGESIKLVAEKLLVKLLKESKFVVEVDKMAKELKTDMRKVFVICNVFEGLRLMEKQGNNVWHWQGRQVLLPTLMMLKQMAERENMIDQLLMVSKLQTKDSSKKVQTNSANKRENTKYNLVMMTQKLIMMFLIIPNPKVLFLPEISIILHGSCLTVSRSKTSVQKLEEISDVMQSLGLVARVLVRKEVDTNGTSAYQYVGQELPVVAFLNKESEANEMEEELDAVRIIINENDIHMDEITEDGTGRTDSSESQEGDKVTGKLQKYVRGEEMNDGGKGDS